MTKTKKEPENSKQIFLRLSGQSFHSFLPVIFDFIQFFPIQSLSWTFFIAATRLTDQLTQGAFEYTDWLCERHYDSTSVQVGHVCCMTAPYPCFTVINGENKSQPPHTHLFLKTREATVALVCLFAHLPSFSDSDRINLNII